MRREWREWRESGLCRGGYGQAVYVRHMITPIVVMVAKQNDLDGIDRKRYLSTTLRHAGD